MKRYVLYMAYRHGGSGTELDLYPSDDGEWVKAEEALALEASLDMADRAGLELAKQLEDANARVAELESELTIAWEEDPLVPELRARVAELEASEKQAREMSVTARMLLKEDGEMQALLDAANARADAAEREETLEYGRAERYKAEAAALRASVERCKAVLSRRYSEPGHWENPNGELCSADELEAALEDK